MLSRQTDLAFAGAEVFSSLEEALAACPPDETVFIIGGESVYAEALPLADRLYLTHIQACPAAADAFFPDLDERAWKLVHSESYGADEKNAVSYTFSDYERK